MQLTATDRAILRVVQRDAGITLAALAARVGLSPSSAQRSLQKLREAGVILRDVAVVDPKRIGAKITLLVELEVERDRPDLLASLHDWVATSDEIQQAWSVTGSGDYLLVVIVDSIEEFDAFSEDMMVRNQNIRKFTTSVTLRTLKRTLEIPVSRSSSGCRPPVRFPS